MEPKFKADAQEVLDRISQQRIRTRQICADILNNADYLYYRCKDKPNMEKHKYILELVNPSNLPISKKEVVKTLNSLRIPSSSIHAKICFMLCLIFLIAFFYVSGISPINPDSYQLLKMYFLVPSIFIPFALYLYLELSTFSLYRLPPEYNPN